MTDLDPRRIDLWFVFLGEIRNPALLSAYRELLSDAERQQVSRFLFERDRHRCLVTRVLLRLVLSKYVEVAPADWIFAANPYGRPYIANDDISARRMRFNIAHTNSVIVLGIACDRELGVDVEDVHEYAGEAPMEIADRFFAADEVAALLALSGEQQQQRFFEYWTLKESYIKARGMGLSIPLDQFSFHFDAPGQVRLVVHATQADDPARWHFWQFRATPRHLVAVCPERDRARSLQLTMRKIVPLMREEVVDYPLTRVCDYSRR